MNKVLWIRILLFMLALILIILLLKIYKAIKSERRIARYSLKMNQTEEQSYFDKLWEKYHSFLSYPY